MQTAFGAQAARLSGAAAALLLVAACEETGDLDTVLRAAAALGAGQHALAEAEGAGLLVAHGASVAFKHPLARSAVLQASPLTRKLEAHRALAGALATSARPDADDRAAWHQAAAATGADEAVAATLEQAAHHAATRTGYAAQAAALERAAELTPDPATRNQRLVTAAEAALAAGDLHRTAAITRQVRLSSGSELAPRIGQLRAAVEFKLGSVQDAARILLETATGLSGPVAEQMLVDAVNYGYFAGDVDLTLRAATRLRETAPESPFSVGLLGLAWVQTGDTAHAFPPMRALTAFALSGPDPALTPGQRLVAGLLGLVTGDDESALEVFSALAAEARDQAALGWLPIALEHVAIAEFFTGRVRDAWAHAEEGLVLAESTGQTHSMHHLRCVMAWIAAQGGDDTRCLELAGAAVGSAPDHQDIRSATWGMLALGLLDICLAQYEPALDRLEAAVLGPIAAHPALVYFAADLVEAAVRAGKPDRAAEPLRQFRIWAAASGRPWVLAVAERCAALLAADDEADRHFAEAVRLHAKGGRPFERARTDLLYGEWLRRAFRKSDARARLRSALRAFEQLGARPWADRARAELRAAGDTAAAATPDDSVLDRLTPQELQVVRLAAQGMSNRAIGAKLFLSSRTVGYHLYKAYPKLGVTGRGELAKLFLT
jgi:DNA-binding NarL/FixJ family response regulator